MKENTYISNILESNYNRNRYDAEVKKILSDKTILAWIMQYTVEEFAGYSIEEIRECIEGTPEVSTARVRPGHMSEEITGMNSEDSVPGEGSITYDIRFYVIIPNGECIKLIINVEAQKSFYPGYDIVTRAVFYCARLLSAQYGTEFTSKNYNDIKKVYSIWICMEVPRELEHKIAKYKMTKEDVYGCVPDKARYDLLEVVMIYLGRETSASQGSKLHGLLQTLLSNRLKPDEKKNILENEYGIATSVEMEGGTKLMCNLSELIEEKGIEKGKKEVLMSLVEKGLLSVEEAAAELGVAVEEFRELLEV